VLTETTVSMNKNYFNACLVKVSVKSEGYNPWPFSSKVVCYTDYIYFIIIFIYHYCVNIKGDGYVQGIKK